jgi:hypothetical protein
MSNRIPKTGVWEPPTPRRHDAVGSPCPAVSNCSQGRVSGVEQQELILPDWLRHAVSGCTARVRMLPRLPGSLVASSVTPLEASSASSGPKGSLELPGPGASFDAAPAIFNEHTSKTEDTNLIGFLATPSL